MSNQIYRVADRDEKICMTEDFSKTLVESPDFEEGAFVQQYEAAVSGMLAALPKF